QTAGPHTWTVYLRYQCSGLMHETVLQLSARLVTEVMVQPAIMVLFAGRTEKHEIVITDLRRKPLAITAVHTSSSPLRPLLSQPTADVQGDWLRTISLEVAADYPEGRHDEILEICSDDPAYPILRVLVTLIKRSQQLTATPSDVSLTAPS